MSRERAIGLVILLLVIFLLVVMFRACRTGSVDPGPPSPPAEGVVFAETSNSAVTGYSL